MRCGSATGAACGGAALADALTRVRERQRRARRARGRRRAGQDEPAARGARARARRRLRHAARARVRARGRASRSASCASSSSRCSTRPRRTSGRAGSPGAAALAGAMFEPSAPAATAVGDDATFQRLHGLYWLTANLSDDRPLVISVDDAQWADEPSLQFLGFLARRSRRCRSLLLVATRPVNEDTRPALTQLVADPATEVLRPRPLSGAAVGRLLAARIGADADGRVRARVPARDAGQPAAAERAAARGDRARASRRRPPRPTRVEALGPQGVGTVVLARHRAHARRGQRARPGARRPRRRRRRCARRRSSPAGLEDAVPALRTLLAAEVVVEGDGLGFVHPIVRAAVYDSIPDRSAAALARGAHARRGRRRGRGRSARSCSPRSPAGDPWAVEALRAAARRALAPGRRRAAR